MELPADFLSLGRGSIILNREQLVVCHPLHRQAEELLLLLLQKESSAWRQEVERVEDLCYTCKP